VQFYIQFAGCWEVLSEGLSALPTKSAPMTKEPLAASKFPALSDTIGTLGPSVIDII